MHANPITLEDTLLTAAALVAATLFAGLFIYQAWRAVKEEREHKARLKGDSDFWAAALRSNCLNLEEFKEALRHHDGPVIIATKKPPKPTKGHP